eukprot:TRINITY_DN1356_c0_g1_i4.p1 TRINITY_DN1356_c0_g1~~TRINITY_DN1356_c0_g1_i4.p1  ORF type:complete len:184 (-),score=24.54 TRINITY_DN1356_c0_g1_i4:489-1040(-)
MNDEDLSSWWHAAAASVSRFNKQCHLEEKRQETRGIRGLCETVAQYIKLKCDSDRIEASGVLRFLHQQTALLANKVAASRHLVNPCLRKSSQNRRHRDPQACAKTSLTTTKTHLSKQLLLLWHKCVAVCVVVAQVFRYTHVRQQSVSRASSAARVAAQELVKFFSVYDGQLVEKAALLEFLQR